MDLIAKLRQYKVDLRNILIVNGPTEVPKNNSFYFLTKSNLEFLHREMLMRNERECEVPRAIMEKTLRNLRTITHTWAKAQNINQYQSVSDDVGDISSTLGFINRQFLEHIFNTLVAGESEKKKAREAKYKSAGEMLDPTQVLRDSLKMSELNVARRMVDVSGKKVQPDQMMPEDYQSLDVWRPIVIERSDQSFRSNNAIHHRDIMMHQRNYDKYSDTLHNRNGVHDEDVLIFNRYDDMSQLWDPKYTVQMAS